MNRSARRVSFGGIQSDEVNPFTSAAMRVGNAEASNLVMGPTPLTPASRFFHASGAPIPTGDTTPSPVTTTLRFDMDSAHATRGRGTSRQLKCATGELLGVAEGFTA